MAFDSYDVVFRGRVMSLKGKKLRLLAFAFLNAAVILAVCAVVSGFTRIESGFLIEDPHVPHGYFWPWAAGTVACGVAGAAALFRGRAPRTGHSP